MKAILLTFLVLVIIYSTVAVPVTNDDIVPETEFPIIRAAAKLAVRAKRARNKVVFKRDLKSALSRHLKKSINSTKRIPKSCEELFKDKSRRSQGLPFQACSKRIAGKLLGTVEEQIGVLKQELPDALIGVSFIMRHEKSSRGSYADGHAKGRHDERDGGLDSFANARINGKTSSGDDRYDTKYATSNKLTFKDALDLLPLHERLRNEVWRLSLQGMREKYNNLQVNVSPSKRALQTAMITGEALDGATIVSNIREIKGSKSSHPAAPVVRNWYLANVLRVDVSDHSPTRSHRVMNYPRGKSGQGIFGGKTQTAAEKIADNIRCKQAAVSLLAQVSTPAAPAVPAAGPIPPTINIQLNICHGNSGTKVVHYMQEALGDASPTRLSWVGGKEKGTLPALDYGDMLMLVGAFDPLAPGHLKTLTQPGLAYQLVWMNRYGEVKKVIHKAPVAQM